MHGDSDSRGSVNEESTRKSCCPAHVITIPIYSSISMIHLHEWYSDC